MVMAAGNTKHRLTDRDGERSRVGAYLPLLPVFQLLQEAHDSLRGRPQVWVRRPYLGQIQQPAQRGRPRDHG